MKDKKLSSAGINLSTLSPDPENRNKQISELYQEARKHFFFDEDNFSLKVNEDDWPSQRRYLGWWMRQINHALVKSRKEIGKAIRVDIIGEKTENVLEQDVVGAQGLSIRVSELSEKEVQQYIMDLIKNKKTEKKEAHASNSKKV